MSIDLTDAYFHIPIYHPHRKYLWFSFQGTCYKYRVLPFSLSLSPRVFVQCSEAAITSLRRRSVGLAISGRLAAAGAVTAGSRSTYAHCVTAPAGAGFCDKPGKESCAGGDFPGAVPVFRHVQGTFLGGTSCKLRLVPRTPPPGQDCSLQLVSLAPPSGPSPHEIYSSGSLHAV